MKLSTFAGQRHVNELWKGHEKTQGFGSQDWRAIWIFSVIHQFVIAKDVCCRYAILFVGLSSRYVRTSYVTAIASFIWFKLRKYSTIPKIRSSFVKQVKTKSKIKGCKKINKNLIWHTWMSGLLFSLWSDNDGRRRKNLISK